MRGTIAGIIVSALIGVATPYFINCSTASAETIVHLDRSAKNRKNAVDAERNKSRKPTAIDIPSGEEKSRENEKKESYRKDQSDKEKTVQNGHESFSNVSKDTGVSRKQNETTGIASEDDEGSVENGEGTTVLVQKTKSETPVTQTNSTQNPNYENFAILSDGTKLKVIIKNTDSFSDNSRGGLEPAVGSAHVNIHFNDANDKYVFSFAVNRTRVAGLMRADYFNFLSVEIDKDNAKMYVSKKHPVYFICVDKTGEEVIVDMHKETTRGNPVIYRFKQREFNAVKDAKQVYINIYTTDKRYEKILLPESAVNAMRNVVFVDFRQKKKEWNER